MNFTEDDFVRLEGIVRRYLLEARPDQYDDYGERLDLCERILGRQVAASIIKAGRAA